MARANSTQTGWSAATVPFSEVCTRPLRMVDARSVYASVRSGASRKVVAAPRYAREFLSRKKAESGVCAYFEPFLVRKPKIVRLSQRMRMPRSEQLQRD